MTAKQLLPNQCDYLHPFYGADNCCLCKANLEIEELRKRVLELEAKQCLKNEEIPISHS